MVGVLDEVVAGASMTSPLSTAADALVADADELTPDAIRHMAHEMMQAYGCTYSAAKSRQSSGNQAGGR